MTGLVTMLVIDDDLNSLSVSGEIRDAVLDFGLGLGLDQASLPTWLNDENQVAEIAGFHDEDLWGVLSMSGNLARPKGSATVNLELRVYGFTSWHAAQERWDNIRPRIVMTDLYDGSLDSEDDWHSVESLPGRKFTLETLKKSVPTIIFSSSKVTIVKFQTEWQALGYESGSPLYFYTREKAFRDSAAVEALRKIWQHSISAMIWNTEYDLAVRGRRDGDKHSLHFYRPSDGETLSRREVTASVYVHYYLWAHASSESLLQQWDDYEIDWRKRRCPILGSPPSNRSSAYSQNQTAGVEPRFNEELKEFHKDGRSKALRANIDRFDAPSSDIPQYFDASEVSGALLSSLAPSLSDDGLTWLKNQLKTLRKK